MLVRGANFQDFFRQGWANQSFAEEWYFFHEARAEIVTFAITALYEPILFCERCFLTEIICHLYTRSRTPAAQFQAEREFFKAFFKALMVILADTSDDTLRSDYKAAIKMIAEHCLIKLLEDKRRSYPNDNSDLEVLTLEKNMTMLVISEAVNNGDVLKPYQIERFIILSYLYGPHENDGFKGLATWALAADDNFAQLQLVAWVMGSFEFYDPLRNRDRHAHFFQSFFQKLAIRVHARPNLQLRANAILQHHVLALIEKGLENMHDQPMQVRLQGQLTELLVCERAFLGEGAPSQLTAWINEQKTKAHTWARAQKPSLFRSFLIALVRLVRAILFRMGLVGSIKTTGGKLWHSNMKYHLSVLKGRDRGEALFARFLLPSMVLDHQWSRLPEGAEQILPLAERASYQQLSGNEALAAFDVAGAAAP